jgi:hypothetical protein
MTTWTLHQIFSRDMGLPLTPATTFMLETSGDFYGKARLHRLTHSTAISSVQYLMLFPLSFPAFTPSELISVPRLASLRSPRCPRILQPVQTAVYASIMRTMLAYPRSSPTRTVLQSDLSELIGYNLYDLQDVFYFI